jgi:hypothetical protein
LISIRLLILSNKSSERTVVSSFTFRREKAAWKLFLLQVMGDALTTFSFPAAGFISTRAFGFIFFHMTFHHKTPLSAYAEDHACLLKHSGAQARALPVDEYEP